ncbi:MAG: tetratricopeptide repeat protein [Myxococcota bacterium]
MPTFWTYYLAWVVLAYVLRNPSVLAGIVLFLLLRPYIPDPKAVFRALSRSRTLRAQVALNPANAVARRELAEIFLETLRPRAALKLVDEALQRAPDHAELTFLRGLALQRSGRNEAALAPLVRAVELDPRVRFGEPFMVAGDALSALRRHEEAVDAYERYVEANTSDVAGYVRLARAHARLGQRSEAQKQLREGLDTLASLPGWRTRRAVFRAYLAAFWTQVWWLRQPTAIAFFLLSIVIVAGLARAAYPVAVDAWAKFQDSTWAAPAWTGDAVHYRGHLFHLTRSYDDYDDYKNDPNNLRQADLPEIERLMLQAKIGPSFHNWADFVTQESAIAFPGYGSGGGPRINATDREFMVSSIEIPGTQRERIFVLEKRPDGSLQLVDDFVAPSPEAPSDYPAEAFLRGSALQYFTQEQKLVRETKL